MSKDKPEDLIRQHIQKQLEQSYKDGWENCVEFIEKSLVEIFEKLGGYPSMEYFIHRMLPDIKKSVKEILDVRD